MSPLKLLPAALLLFATPVLAVGAIAVDMNDPSLKPAYGYAINYPDRSSAEQAAVEYCRRSAGKNADCRAMVWFEKCGAYGNSKTTFGIGYGATEMDAKGKVAQMCSPNGESCYLVFAVCEN